MTDHGVGVHGTGKRSGRYSLPRHTPGMNEWHLWQSIVHECDTLIVWEEERVSCDVFYAIVVVDWYCS